MSIVLIGAVEGSKVAFDSLVAAGLAPDHVVTLPPDAAGRHSDFVDLTSPARAIGSAVIHTKNINNAETLAAIAAAKPDLCLVMGWSQICHVKFRSIARLGNIGFHPAPLPELRGRAVIPWTILLDYKETGASLFWLDEGTDSGNILLQRKIPVDAQETARTLYEKQTKALAGMLPEAVTLALTGNAPSLVQNHEQATYCAKRTPDDGWIDWHDAPANILRLIRAVGDPYPGAFTTYDGHRLWIDQARLFPDGRRYIGLTGQIQAHSESGFIVRCADGKCIEVTSWRYGTDKLPKMHSILGKDEIL